MHQANLTDEQLNAIKVLRAAGFHVYHERQIADFSHRTEISPIEIMRFRSEHSDEYNRYISALKSNAGAHVGAQLAEDGKTEWRVEETGMGGKIYWLRLRVVKPFASDADIFTSGPR